MRGDIDDIIIYQSISDGEARRNRGERRNPMELLLTNMEVRALKETLEAEISNLQMEIVASRDRGTREEMITRKELLLSVLEKLPAPVLDVA